MYVQEPHSYSIALSCTKFPFCRFNMSKLLLDILKDDLGELIDTPEAYKIADGYLTQILANEDLFLLEHNTGLHQASETPTIVEEIAELDLKQHNIDADLQRITAENKEVIVDIANVVLSIQKESLADFVSKISKIAQIVQLPETNAKLANLSVPEKVYASIDTNNSILSSVDPVLDLLELPALCRLCILRGNYQETLEILTTVQSLIIRFPSIKVFQTIYEQVEKELQTMVTGLVKLLSGNIKQGNIIKIFQILMKLNINRSFQEKRLGASADLFLGPETSNFTNNYSNSPSTAYLHMLYLDSRFLFILKEVDALKPLIKFNKLTYLKRYIETYREHIFNTLSCYYAIFGKSASPDQNIALLLNQFVSSLVGMLVDEFEKYYSELPSEDEVDQRANEDGLLLQTVYLARSLAKFKVDCEAILVWELIFNRKLISQDDWTRNLKKVKKLR